MRRREFIAALGCAAGALPFAARAQQTKIPRIGVIWIGSPEHESVVLGSLRKALADQEYVFGRDLVFDERYANGKEERIATLIAELLAVGVDVLVTPGTLPIKRRRRSPSFPSAPSSTLGSRPASLGRAATSPASTIRRTIIA